MTDEQLIIWTEAYLAGIDQGYQMRVDEEAERPAADPKVLAFGRWYDQAQEREKHDAETARLIAEATA